MTKDGRGRAVATLLNLNSETVNLLRISLVATCAPIEAREVSSDTNDTQDPIYDDI